jgi:hypothetical protein
MEQFTVVPLRQPEEIVDPLTEILRSGARRLIAQAVDAEFEAFLSQHAELRLPTAGVGSSATATRRRARSRRESAHGAAA